VVVNSEPPTANFQGEPFETLKWKSCISADSDAFDPLLSRHSLWELGVGPWELIMRFRSLCPAPVEVNARPSFRAPAR